VSIQKIYISANDLLLDSFRLGVAIHNSDFKPDFIVGVWRGGTPVGIAIQEILSYLGNKTDHIAIRTSSYVGINQQKEEVQVHGLSYLIRNINSDDKLLLVDDVFDSGKSIQAIIDTLNIKSRKNTPKDIRVAVPWYKPDNNKTKMKPDYFIHKTNDWLIFPHEMEGLEKEEIFTNKPGLKEILSLCKK
jgi:hypoxanthine phosphoribosyltransferase